MTVDDGSTGPIPTAETLRYQAWEEGGITRLAIVCGKCQRRIGSVRESSLGLLYCPDKRGREHAASTREPEAVRQWRDSTKSNPVYGDLKWPAPSMFVVVPIDEDDDAFAWCPEHKARELTCFALRTVIEQNRRRLAV